MMKTATDTLNAAYIDTPWARAIKRYERDGETFDDDDVAAAESWCGCAVGELREERNLDWVEYGFDRPFGIESDAPYDDELRDCGREFYRSVKERCLIHAAEAMVAIHERADELQFSD